MTVVGIHQSVSNVDDSIQQQQQPTHLTTFHSPIPSSSSNHYNLKKTVQALTRRPMVDMQSTYLTYDTIDAPPPPPPPPAASCSNTNLLYPNHSSTACSSAGSSTSREYSI